MTLARRNAPVLAAVLGGWLVVALACWVVTQAGFAPGARRLLAVHLVERFADPPGEALGIWLNNSKITAGVAVCIAFVALARWILPAGRAGAERIPMWFADAILAVWAVAQAALAGVLIGAYGSAQLRAFLPDGPVEVTAWALLGALYVNARRGRNGWRGTVWGLVAVEVLLALAAILEAFGGVGL